MAGTPQQGNRRRRRINKGRGSSWLESRETETRGRCARATGFSKGKGVGPREQAGRIDVASGLRQPIARTRHHQDFAVIADIGHVELS